MTRETVFAAIGSDLVHCSVDTRTGEVTEHGRIALPSLIEEGVRHPTLPLRYVVCTDREGGPNLVVTIDTQPGSGPRVVGDPVELPARAVHLTIDPAGALLVATHTDATAISILPVDVAGRPGTPSEHPVDGPLGVYLHDTEFTQSGDRAVLVARGQTGRTGTAAVAGRVHLTAVDDGRLSVLDTLDLSADFGDEGFNPRNVAFHPTLPVAYVTLEAQNRVVTIRFDGDRMVAVPGAHPGLLDDPQHARARQLGGVLDVTPDGRTLVAVTRADGPIIDPDRWRTPAELPAFEGGENTLSVFRLDPDGVPALVQRIDSGGISARCITFLDHGGILVAANSKPMLGPTGNPADVIPAALTVFRVGDDGRLTRLASHPFEVGRATLWWLG